MILRRKCPICYWEPASGITHEEFARRYAAEIGGFRARRHFRQVAKQATNRALWVKILRRGGFNEGGVQ